jgi:hypothetical protein
MNSRCFFFIDPGAFIDGYLKGQSISPPGNGLLKTDLMGFAVNDSKVKS